MKKILYKAQRDYLNSLQKEDDPLIQEMENFAAENNVPILNRDSADFLEQLVAMQRPERVLEIGAAIGYSSIKIARNLKNKGNLDALEISKENIKFASKFIQRSGLESKINMIETDALAWLPEQKEKYDFIFLDADKEDYEKLFYYSLILLKKKGMIFIDNLLWHGYVAASKVPDGYKRSTEQIRNFNKLFISQNALMTTILPIGDGIGLGYKTD